MKKSIEVDEEETLIQKRKRTRYASKQKHTVTERKRREKINSRLDQLKQLLLPNNAYKMDRASMLDAAIAEVKHLQYQVQVFSTVLQYPRSLIQQQLRNEEGAKEPVVAPVLFPPIPLIKQYMSVRGSRNEDVCFEKKRSYYTISGGM
ncbi:hypothetical protein ZOSMA_118G00600 [Zostera marina]|uniref:BHLH domain-containing protein n=1 Tax=Zostera marina TaxID=29655 RepID=A0A0K9Q403_ZOSMR|nr:hypothetical protein ZOSMA_118G00600 [Zostera marina]